MKTSRLKDLIVNTLAVTIILIALAITVTTVYAAISVNLEQCANASDGSNTTCAGQGSTGWVNGQVGTNKSYYFEGDFLPYRRVYTGLTNGWNYCFGMSYDLAQGGLPAIDYLATFSQTITLADPTVGTVHDGSVNSPDDTLAIPKDNAIVVGTMSGNSFSDSQIDGHLTIWGGTLLSAGPYSNDGSVDFATDGISEAQSMEYCFNVTEATGEVVVAWSGHVAVPAQWSAPSKPSGSPYHMANGTKNNLFTSPRTSETDLAGYDPLNPATQTHTNIGRAELQLAVSETPTAITLTNLRAESSDGNLGLALLGVGIAFFATAALIVYHRRQRQLSSSNDDVRD